MEVKNILLIEDDLMFAKLFERKIGRLGDFSIHHCETVEAGLHFIDHTEPDLIFMDHELDGMNGVDSIRLFKGVLKNVEICVVSSQIDPKVVGKALDQKVKYFRKDSLLMQYSEEFISEIREKKSPFLTFWTGFLDMYTNSIPQLS